MQTTPNRHMQAYSANLPAGEHPRIIVPCSRAPDKALLFQYEDYVLTHPLTACGPVPTALDPTESILTSATAKPPTGQFFRGTHHRLENRFIKVTVSPDIRWKSDVYRSQGSGKEVRMFPKSTSDTDPARFTLWRRIEVSFPISHSPSQNEKTPL